MHKFLRSNFILVAILAGFLAGCATPQVGPKPNIAPVSTSNAATRVGIKQTRASIKQARDSIKESQVHAAEGATALEKANGILDQMLKK